MTDIESARQTSRTSDLRLLKVSESHIAAARQLLTLIAQTQVEADAPQSDGPHDRTSLLRVARAAFQLRKRRDRIFSKSFYGEPAFDMLLALYVAEGENASLSLMELAELASLPHPSAIRWLDSLVADGFVAREAHPKDRRKLAIKLLPKGRQALDELFGSAVDFGREIS